MHRAIAPLPPVQTWLAGAYSGVAIRYPPAAPARPAGQPAHPLAGARLPPGRLTLPDGTGVRLYELFHDGRFVLLESAAGPAGPGGPACPAAADPAAHVRLVRYRQCAGARLPRTLLVRPDGYVAWASDERDRETRASEASAALAAWCGTR